MALQCGMKIQKGTDIIVKNTVKKKNNREGACIRAEWTGRTAAPAL